MNNTHYEERMIIEVPRWAQKEPHFWDFWKDLWVEKSEEITDWLNVGNAVVFRPEGSDE